MVTPGIEQLGTYLESWAQSAPKAEDMDPYTRDAMDALVEAGMVQYKPGGWDFKLHEKNPDAPKAEFKLMIREAPGVNTHPSLYDRFVLPTVMHAGESELLGDAEYVVGYPNAGTAIAAALVRLAKERLGIKVEQLEQDKVVFDDGKRELGDITTPFREGAKTWAADDTATGGDTKIEGWRKVVQHGLSYAGLFLIVERDPLGTALVRERTKAPVYSSIHWLTLAQHAVRSLELPEEALQLEMSYPLRLFEWNVANNKLGSLPSPELLTTS